MAWKSIERIGDAPANPPPANGVRVSFRGLKARGGKSTGYINIVIGADLAKAASFHLEEQQVRLMIGERGSNEAGKICVMVDQEGQFTARGKPGKNYKIAIGGRSAAGLFAQDFESFDRANVELIKPTNGQPRHFVFLATAQMLAVDG